MAKVRGIGVAVAINWCGQRPPARTLLAQSQPLMDAETMLFVHDRQCQFGERRPPPETTRGYRPRSGPHRWPTAPAPTADLPVSRPVSQATSIPNGSSQVRRLRSCCSASSSVGAINAAWAPFSTARNRRRRPPRFAGADIALQQRSMGRGWPSRRRFPPAPAAGRR